MNIEELKVKIIPILKRHGVIRAGVFGSVARGEARPDSDVDILVEMSRSYDLLDFIGFKHELEKHVGTKVDVLEYRAIKPVIRDSILASEVVIYG